MCVNAWINKIWISNSLLFIAIENFWKLLLNGIHYSWSAFWRAIKHESGYFLFRKALTTTSINRCFGSYYFWYACYKFLTTSYFQILFYKKFIKTPKCTHQDPRCDHHEILPQISFHPPSRILHGRGTNPAWILPRTWEIKISGNVTELLWAVKLLLIKKMSLWTPWTHILGVEVWLHSFLTSILDKGKW